MTANDVLNNMLQSPGLQTFVDTYNTSTVVVLAIATLIVLIMLIYNISKIAQSADNPNQRSEAIKGTVVCLVSFAVIGSIDLIYAIVVNMIIGS